MKKGLKVFGWCILAFVIFCFVVGALSDDDESTSNTSEQVVGEEAAQQDESVFAIYNVTDKSGSKITITLNKDETAIIEKDGTPYYCSWTKPAVMDGIEITYPTSDDDKPIIAYDGDVREVYSIWIKDGWLYADFSSAKAKNPKWRIKVN